jgi:hypothetical protein
LPVPEATVPARLATAALTALVHTLIPDHWLPFVLVGRSRGWTPRTVATVSGLSALIHTLLSVLLGLSTALVGLGAARALGETLESVGAGLLVAFGLVYAAWAWRKGGHFHPGGERLHAGGSGALACAGGEGAHERHLHYHADREWIEARPPGLGAVGLAVIVGVNPCVLILPLLLAAIGRGPGMVALVTLAYAVPTVVLMVGLSVLGVRTRRQVPLAGLARYVEPASGLLVALVGLAAIALGG